MYAWFLKLPRASSRARLLAAFMALFAIMGVCQAWPNLRADLAIARWIAWSSVLIGLVWLPMLLLISLAGRMPKTLARRIPDALHMSLGELHGAIKADVIREQHRSREL